MSTYTSKPVTVNCAAEQLTDKFRDFTTLRERLEQLPAEQRQAVGEIKFTHDTIQIDTKQLQTITLKAKERSDSALVLEAEGTPVPLFLKISYKPLTAESSEVVGAIDVDLPLLLKPMVGPMLQKFADKFGELFAALA